MSVPHTLIPPPLQETLFPEQQSLQFPEQVTPSALVHAAGRVGGVGGVLGEGAVA